jgi:hypothetical protein
MSKVTEAESVSPNAEEPKLCQALVNGTGPNGIEFNEPVTISHEEIAKRYGETTAGNAALVDFDNTGVAKKVVSLDLSSGAGVGCEEPAILLTWLSTWNPRWLQRFEISRPARLQTHLPPRYS